MSITDLPTPDIRTRNDATRLPEFDRSFDGPSFEDRMATIDFRVAPKAHITVDSDVCRSCTTKACVTACPAALFVPTSDGGVLFNYEQCFECGTCYLVCNKEGALTWTYPEGGAGVAYRRA
jgi:ferredoxin like protein